MRLCKSAFCFAAAAPPSFPAIRFCISALESTLLLPLPVGAAAGEAGADDAADPSTAESFPSLRSAEIFCTARPIFSLW